MNMEIWKDIPNYEGFYQASNLGRIRSLPRNGTIKAVKIITQGKTKFGRLKIILRKSGVVKTFNTHRLIAQTFISNTENKPCINHKDHNPLNNNIENLEWVTHSENMKYDFITKYRTHRGDNHNNRKLNSFDVKVIRFLKVKLSQKDIAYMFDVCRTNITLILNNKIWGLT